jgi:colicin import membrane protein
MADTTPYFVPQEPGRWRAIALAVAVHAALFVFLWIGIRWQSETPVAIEAEVWDMQAKDAAPKQIAPPPEPQVQPEPQPRPEREPEAASKPEPKAVEKAPVEKPDIALEQERKKKEKARREEEERQARLKEEKEQAEKEKKAQAEKEKKALAEKEKKEEAKKEKEKQLALEKEKAALEKEKAALEKQKAELAKKEKAEAERKRQEALDAKLLAQMRKDAQKNFAGVAGSGGTGTAAKSQGMRGDPSYAAKVAAKIKSNTAFGVPSDLQGNPTVEYDVQLFPDGSLRGAPRKVKSSGISAFDEAVRRAIDLSAPYPADKSGTVPSGFQVIQRPKEQ